MTPDQLKDATPDGPIQVVTTYRQVIGGQVFAVEGRRQIPEPHQVFSTYPETYHTAVNVNAGPQGIFPVELTIPGDNIRDVFATLPQFMLKEVPIQAPIQIQAAVERARAQQSLIKRLGQ